MRSPRPSRIAAALAALLVAMAAAPAGAGDETLSGGPWHSYVEEPVLVACPAGDLPIHCVAIDIAGVLSPNSVVALDYGACNALVVAPAAPSDPYVIDTTRPWILMVTGLDGRATFPLRAGGGCPGSALKLYVDGFPFATRTVISPDQNGDLLVDGVDLALLLGKRFGGAYDPGADLNLDGRVDAVDIATLLRHRGHRS